MSDIFREVEEEIRRDQLAAVWKRHGTKIIVAAVVLVAAVGGWRIWQSYETRMRAAAGEAFETAIALSNAEKPKEAVDALEPLAASGPEGYRILARMMAAGELAKIDPAGARAAYEALAADAKVSPALRDLARVRAAAMLVDSAPFAETAGRLRPLAVPNAPFRHYARELLAAAAVKAGETAAAREVLDQIIADGETPPGVRQRAEILIGLVRAGPDGKS